MSSYANLVRVLAILDAEEIDAATFDALNETVSNELDAACRVTGFGTTPEPITRWFAAPYAGGIVVIDPPAVTVETVSDYSYELDPETYRLIWTDDGVAYGLERTDGGGFAGEVAITGTFADQPPGAVPVQIVEAANQLVAGSIRRDRMPAGEVSGPEGLTFRPSNPWSHETVKRAVDRYRVTPLVV